MKNSPDISFCTFYVASNVEAERKKSRNSWGSILVEEEFNGTVSDIFCRRDVLGFLLKHLELKKRNVSVNSADNYITNIQPLAGQHCQSSRKLTILNSWELLSGFGNVERK